MLVRKLYIDSKARTSGDDNDFEIALKTNLQCPGQGRAYVDNVFLCNVFGTVDETRDLLVLEETDAAHSQTFPHSVLLPHGNKDAFSLATALPAALNATTSVPGVYSGSFSELTHTLSVSATRPFRLFTDKEAGTAWQTQDVARSANLVIGNIAVSAVSTLWHANLPPDLHRVKQLFSAPHITGLVHSHEQLWG